MHYSLPFFKGTPREILLTKLLKESMINISLIYLNISLRVTIRVHINVHFPLEVFVKLWNVLTTKHISVAKHFNRILLFFI